jgi:hypothetical protein
VGGSTRQGVAHGIDEPLLSEVDAPRRPPLAPTAAWRSRCAGAVLRAPHLRKRDGGEVVRFRGYERDRRRQTSKKVRFGIRVKIAFACATACEEIVDARAIWAGSARRDQRQHGCGKTEGESVQPAQRPGVPRWGHDDVPGDAVGVGADESLSEIAPLSECPTSTGWSS